MRNTNGTPHFQKRVTGVRPVTQWKLSNTGVLDFVMLLHAANQSSVFKVCCPNENRPTEGPASLSGKWEVQSKLDFSASSHPSPARGPRHDHHEPTPQPSTQFDAVLATSFSNPFSASTRREPRSFNLETLSSDQDQGLLSRLLSKIGRWLTGGYQLRY